jgi:hypothetical protein
MADWCNRLAEVWPWPPFSSSFTAAVTRVIVRELSDTASYLWNIDSYFKKLSFLYWCYSYLLRELSSSWGAINCAAPQEPPCILWNPKVQYRVHKSPPMVPILSHINPIHSIPSYIGVMLKLNKISRFLYTGYNGYTVMIAEDVIRERHITDTL